MSDHTILKNEPLSPLRAAAAHLRRGVLWAIFGLLLMIPRLKRLRRRSRTWNLIRVLTAAVGVGMLIVAATRGYAAMPLAAGLFMLLFALMVAPERPELSVDARAKELGVLIVVDGGHYLDACGSAQRAKLFLAPDRLFVLNLALQVLAEIPLQEVRILTVESGAADWTFRVQSAGTTATFIYEGTFGEHLARVAEATLRGQLHRELPVLP